MVKLSFSQKDKLPSEKYPGLLNNNCEKFFSKAFVFLYRFNPDLPHSYLGLAISKKKLKRASNRNSVKRINREAFRLNQNELDFPVEMCVLASKNAVKFSKQEWQQCVSQFWQHLKKHSTSQLKP